MRPRELFKYIVFCFVCFVMFFSCSLLGLKPAKKPPADPRTQAEESFDPLGFPEDWLVVTKREPFRKDIVKDELENEIQTEENLEKKERIKYKTIFRVQIYATKFPGEAYRMADSVRTDFPDEVRVDYEVPYYKVRIGDCATQEEVESLLKKVRRSGYEPAWVVKLKVTEK